MRLNKLFILYSLFGILMASCIKDEAPNAEADITGISFEEDVLASARFNLNPSYNDNLQAYPILVKVKEGTPLNKLSPLFELTPGATISPESGSEHDFSDGKRVKYTVTSENKAWQRVYSSVYANNRYQTSQMNSILKTYDLSMELTPNTNIRSSMKNKTDWN